MHRTPLIRDRRPNRVSRVRGRAPHHVASRAALWAAMVALPTLAACTGAAQTPDEAATTSGEPVTAVTTSVCPATAAFPPDGNRQGAGSGATLWALFFPTEPQLKAGQEIKVVWRMTGSGDLSMSATGPDGSVVQPAWGPQPHGGSNWERPGDEWGTGWVFPTAGCWRIDATRESGSGYLVVRVAQG